MNDRFKFRFWNGKSMSDIIPFGCDLYDINAVIHANMPIMQCTGLKDKNGKLIYEGDILDLYISTKKLYRYQVKYEIGSFMLVSNEEIFYFRNKWNDNAYPLSQLYFEYDNEDNCIWHCEVIGNIYETPELLGEECQK